MLGLMRHGSAADAPYGRLAALKDFFRDTPEGSPLSMGDVRRSPTYLDLWNPRVRVGDPAPDFELPRPEGGTVRLSDFRHVSPVALIFGSYT